jgi:hypothetical protein
MVQVTYGHPIGSLIPNLIGMMYYFVLLESSDESPIGVRCVDVDFYRFIGKSFTVVLFFLQSSREVFHHVAIVGNTVYVK